MGVLAGIFSAILVITACGGSGSSSSNPKGQVSGLHHRVFISNAYNGNLQIVDSQNDTQAVTQQQTVNASGQTITTTTPISISLGSQSTWETVSPDHSTTAVFDGVSNTLYLVSNSSETSSGSVALGGSSGGGVFSTDSGTVYVPIRNLAVSGQQNGAIQAVTASTAAIAASYPVPAAQYLSLSTSGTYLLAFANNSDSVFVLNLKASTITATQVPGFARPVSAFFTNDTTAFVLNCGTECGSTGAPSVTQLNLSTLTLGATVPVGGATVGYLSGNNLYVAGNPGPEGTVDIVNVSNMTRSTATSIPISDGYHSQMAVSTNNKLYVGAITCSNITTGCLSVVDLNTNQADPPLPPNGPITGMLAIANRNTMYVIQKGFLAIYDTTTNTLQAKQIAFTGAVSDVVQVDP